MKALANKIIILAHIRTPSYASVCERKGVLRHFIYAERAQKATFPGCKGVKSTERGEDPAAAMRRYVENLSHATFLL